MRCSSVRRRIDDHVDGLLPAEEAERVRDHLDQCGDCRETAFAAKAASTSLAVWGDLEPPADCFARILHKIDTLPADALTRSSLSQSSRRGGARRAWARIVRISVPAAAAAALVGAVLVTDDPERPRGSGGSGFVLPATAVASPAGRSRARMPRMFDNALFAGDQGLDDGLSRSSIGPVDAAPLSADVVPAGVWLIR